MLAEKLSFLRYRAGLSQERVAEAAGVSRQAVQKWEQGTSTPDLAKLIALAKFFNVSTDYLLLGKDGRSVEQLRVDNRPLPAFERVTPWEAYYKELPTEYRQCTEEGKDLSSFEAVFQAVAGLPDGKDKADLADILYRAVERAPIRSDFGYSEPSDYESIVSCSAAGTGGAEAMRLKVPGKERRLDQMRGALYGRICGCLLGKALEGCTYDELTAFLKVTGNDPLGRYLTRSDLAKADVSSYVYPFEQRVFGDGILDGMPVDDDTNYVVLALLLLKRYGRGFTPSDVAELWLSAQPKDAYCTAERVAFRNFVAGYMPPESARYKNPYREWIGAQIRGDLFGWICPADPTQAASMAFRDASVSHVKNGIYGEMWVSAMLAAVGGGARIGEAMEIGLQQIPSSSRLHEAIGKVLAGFRAGVTADAFFSDFHVRWQDTNPNHWCHTVSNAEIVAASLLYGGGDYGRSVCLAVSQGFDTDCNGATVGSVVGEALGYSGIPDCWTSKIAGTLYTTIFGYEKVSVDRLAEEALAL